MSLIPADTEDHEFKAKLELQSKVLSCFLYLPLLSIHTAHLYIEEKIPWMRFGERTYRQLQTSLVEGKELDIQGWAGRGDAIVQTCKNTACSRDSGAKCSRAQGVWQRTWRSAGEQRWASEETVDRQPGEIRSMHTCGDSVLATQQVPGQPGQHKILPQERSRSQSS